MSFEKLFIESKGQPITYGGKIIKMIDKVIMQSNKAFFKISFISTNSSWKQGVIMQTRGEFEINGQKFPNKIILWEQSAPQEVDLLVVSKDKMFIIYNVWETEDGTIHYWHNGSAMHVEPLNEGKLYNCNDGFDDDDFNDLIFKLEIK